MLWEGLIFLYFVNNIKSSFGVTFDYFLSLDYLKKEE
jgi:hypothetical protein